MKRDTYNFYTFGAAPVSAKRIVSSAKSFLLPLLLLRR